MWYSGCAGYWFSPCAKTTIHTCHSSWQPFLGFCLCQSCAGHLSLMDLACFGPYESRAQGLDSLHWMVWQTKDRTAMISLKTPRVNLCQRWICFFFFNWYLVALQYCVWFRCGASKVAQRVKNLLAMKETQVWSLSRKIPWRRKWQPTAAFLPRELWTREPGGLHTVRGVAKSRIRLND